MKHIFTLIGCLALYYILFGSLYLSYKFVGIKIGQEIVWIPVIICGVLFFVSLVEPSFHDSFKKDK